MPMCDGCKVLDAAIKPLICVQCYKKQPGALCKLGTDCHHVQCRLVSLFGGKRLPVDIQYLIVGILCVRYDEAQYLHLIEAIDARVHENMLSEWQCLAFGFVFGGVVSNKRKFQWTHKTNRSFSMWWVMINKRPDACGYYKCIQGHNISDKKDV
jgi:hypothetical protein